MEDAYDLPGLRRLRATAMNIGNKKPTVKADNNSKKLAAKRADSVGLGYPLEAHDRRDLAAPNEDG